mmetsp:Transcript_3558/g.6592  ORF Transcript_3558/g.6592 Transcript_3558/m.6592 type:complete len:266 (+) Transcript_3558:386-1183(+)
MQSNYYGDGPSEGGSVRHVFSVIIFAVVAENGVVRATAIVATAAANATIQTLQLDQTPRHQIDHVGLASLHVGASHGRCPGDDPPRAVGMRGAAPQFQTPNVVVERDPIDGERFRDRVVRPTALQKGPFRFRDARDEGESKAPFRRRRLGGCFRLGRQPRLTMAHRRRQGKKVHPPSAENVRRRRRRRRRFVENCHVVIILLATLRIEIGRRKSGRERHDLDERIVPPPGENVHFREEGNGERVVLPYGKSSVLTERREEDPRRV